MLVIRSECFPWFPCPWCLARQTEDGRHRGSCDCFVSGDEKIREKNPFIPPNPLPLRLNLILKLSFGYNNLGSPLSSPPNVASLLYFESALFPFILTLSNVHFLYYVK